MIRSGVNQTEQGFSFVYANPKEEACSLLLYKRGQAEPEQIIEMKNCLGDFYTAEVKLKDPQNYEYVYRIGEEIVTDPYAKGITGKQAFGVFTEESELRGTFHRSSFDWEGDQPLRLPFTESVMYCTHLRGYTMDESSKVQNPGTFLGMTEKIPYLQSLGITQLELMPIYEFEEYPKPKDRQTDSEKKLPKMTIPKENRKFNYWGYSEGFYFAPKKSYAAGEDASAELKELVKALHRAGIELILEFYFEQGTAPNLILDCLRYWVSEYHLDGIHLNRGCIDGRLLTEDPLLKKTKIFTEYFDGSEFSGEHTDAGKKRLAEYHDGFLVDARRLLRGDWEMVGPFCDRVRKNPKYCSVVNYLANHNGFTMRDMVSYDKKHNEANGEKNRDGSSENHSWNCGVEGATKDEEVLKLRNRQLRNAFAMVFFSQGIPLIYGGDEFGNSQQGNNNAYGQDNPLGWIQWSETENAKALTEYVRALIAFRKNHDVFREEKEAEFSDYRYTGIPDLSYHSEQAWCGNFAPYSRKIAMFYGPAYARSEENPIYVAYNFYPGSQEFGLPKLTEGREWRVIFDSSAEKIFEPEGRKLPDKKHVTISGRTICVLEGVSI